MTESLRELRHEYAQQRRLAEQRTGRLEKAGFGGYHAPKLADIKDLGQLRRELNRVTKWNLKDTATVRGARVAHEQQLAARRERAAERRRERAAAEGRQYQPRPPKQTEEQRRESKRESNRRYREKVKAQKEDINKGILEYAKTHTKKQTQALLNLQKGLAKYGIKVKSFKELKAWGDYIKEREADSNKEFYLFDQWLQEAAEEIGKEKEKVTGTDIERMMKDFNEWRAQNDELIKEYARERQTNEYTSEQIWQMFAWRRM